MKNNKPLALVCKRLSEVNSDFEELVMLLNQELAIINGDKNDFFIQFNNIDQLRHIVIAYQSGRAVGCGAMKVYGDNMMEIKRMYVRQPYRGKGVASTILSELEKWAVELGTHRCILETHEGMKDAIALYKKNQYAEIERYGQYKDEPNSVCFEKCFNTR